MLQHITVANMDVEARFAMYKALYSTRNSIPCFNHFDPALPFGTPISAKVSISMPVVHETVTVPCVCQWYLH